MIIEILTAYDDSPCDSLIIESSNSRDAWLEAYSIARYERRENKGMSMLFRLNNDFKRVGHIAYV